MTKAHNRPFIRAEKQLWCTFFRAVSADQSHPAPEIRGMDMAPTWDPTLPAVPKSQNKPQPNPYPCSSKERDEESGKKAARSGQRSAMGSGRVQHNAGGLRTFHDGFELRICATGVPDACRRGQPWVSSTRWGHTMVDRHPGTPENPHPFCTSRR